MVGRHSLLAVIALGAAVAAQAPPAAPSSPLTAAIAAWLDSAGTDHALLERATAAVLRDEAEGLRALGGLLRNSADDDAGRVRRRIELGTDVVLGVIDDRRRSGMVFRGQYAALSALQPFASKRLFELLLQTPDWFAETRREQLVPALADVQVDPPPPPILLGTIDLIRNKEVEPDSLRLPLECLVWRWGHKEFVEARVKVLQAASAEGDAEDRVYSMRQLADLWYRVQEYGKAAGVHQAMTAMAGSGELQPTDWYWGACYFALGGRRDDGIAALQKCAALLADPKLDSSLRANLPRQLFERDPEIATLRADERFAAIVEQAFAPAKASGGR